MVVTTSPKVFNSFTNNGTKCFTLAADAAVFTNKHHWVSSSGPALIVDLKFGGKQRSTVLRSVSERLALSTKSPSINEAKAASDKVTAFEEVILVVWASVQSCGATLAMLAARR
jgi:hypothetical protein